MILPKRKYCVGWGADKEKLKMLTKYVNSPSKAQTLLAVNKVLTASLEVTDFLLTILTILKDLNSRADPRMFSVRPMFISPQQGVCQINFKVQFRFFK